METTVHEIRTSNGVAFCMKIWRSCSSRRRQYPSCKNQSNVYLRVSKQLFNRRSLIIGKESRLHLKKETRRMTGRGNLRRMKREGGLLKGKSRNFGLSKNEAGLRLCSKTCSDQVPQRELNWTACTSCRVSAQATTRRGSNSTRTLSVHLTPYQMKDPLLFCSRKSI
jgi:hypothetical protein